MRMDQIYWTSGRVELDALERFWAPVGAAVKGREDALRLLRILFPGEVGRELAADVDARIGALPGLAGIDLMQGFAARAARPGLATSAEAPSAGVVLGAPTLDLGAP